MAGRVATITFKREIAEGEKFPPQLKGIVASAVKDHGVGTELTTEQVVASMEGNIETRQPLARILGYYTPKMLEAELIDVTRAAPAAKKSDDKADADGDIDGDLNEDEDGDEDGDEE